MWSEYRAERQNDTTQYGGSSGSSSAVKNVADEYTKEMSVERVNDMMDEVFVERDPRDESDF